MPTRASQCTAQPATLLARLGGTTKLEALVSAFYFNLLSDVRLASAFADADVGTLLVHQRRFLAFVLGAEKRLYDRSLLRTAHRHLVVEHGLTDSHFDAFVEMLSDTITSLGHDTDIAEGVVAAAESFRDDVLGRP